MKSCPDARRRNICNRSNLKGCEDCKFSCNAAGGNFAFKHLRGPSVLADQLNKTATAQIDGSNAGAGFFDA